MASVNLVIIQLLHTKTNQSDFLRVCWDKMTEPQKREVFHFLYLTDQHKTFLSALRLELNSLNPFIPWSHLFAILNNNNKLHTESIHFFKKANVCLDEIGKFRIQHPLLKSLWDQKKKTVLAKYQDKKSELLKDLDVARQQGFKEQKSKLLDELKQLYPNDPEILVAITAEKELQARSTIHKVFQKKLSQNEWFPSKADIDPQVQKNIMKSVTKALKKSPDSAHDFAIMLYQMELYSEALAVIDKIQPKDERTLWHSLQIAIDGKQYARALSDIDALKQSSISNENSFSLMYYQAISLHGLGRSSEAQKIMSHIVKIRPDFKSADSLLIEWDNEK